MTKEEREEQTADMSMEAIASLDEPALTSKNGCDEGARQRDLGCCGCLQSSGANDGESKGIDLDAGGSHRAGRHPL